MANGSQVYFGFTHCPDICPDELDKMATIIDLVKEKAGGANVMRPVFITCDPARDTPEVLQKYLREFHPDIIGLTGSYEQVKNVCKQYRVYFSTPEHVKAGEDYLVDHSIYFYLMGEPFFFFFPLFPPSCPPLSLKSHYIIGINLFFGLTCNLANKHRS
jgi:cytochrome oxidase Cu insertion factor (SCO1/SenC/PrrC family)